jgi:serine protease Do
LKARRGVFETPYKGDIYVVDFTTNNPGACGGALISGIDGKLLGILGKELRNAENNVWLNFAIPTEIFAPKVQQMIADAKLQKKTPLISTEAVKPKVELIPEDTIRILQDWGILLVSSVAKRTPPFIDSVKQTSEAEKLGLKPDDLIVMVNNRLTPSLAAVEEQLSEAKSGENITLTIERDLNLVDFKFVKK